MRKLILIKRVLSGVLLVVLAGCSHHSLYITGKRHVATGIKKGEQVVVLGIHAAQCDKQMRGDCAPQSTAVVQQDSFEDCVRPGLEETAPGVVLYPATKLQAVLQEAGWLSWDEQTGASAQRHAAAWLQEHGVRYLIFSVLKSERGPSNTRLDVTGGPYVWGTETRRLKISTIDSYVYTAEHDELLGTLSASAHGHEGFVVPVVLFLPLPPIPYTSITDYPACTAIGRAIGRFVTGAGNHDITPRQ